MSNSVTKSIVYGSIWGILAKLLDAGLKFLTIPLLVKYYGRADYALIALAFSLNTYLRLMDMGMNIGSIRFFSVWIAERKWDKISKVSRSSVLFYGTIGILNAIIFIFLTNYSDSLFNLSGEQLIIFRWILYILAISCIFNWVSNVITQLLIAHGEISWTNRSLIFSSFGNLAITIITISFHISIEWYFVLYTITTLIPIPFNLYRLKVFSFISRSKLLFPKWSWKDFREIIVYSMAIFAMGLFQFSADNLRPLILSKFAVEGVKVLTDYQIIQTISSLVIAFGGIFTQALLPSTAKLLSEKKEDTIGTLIYSGTKYISAFIAFIVFLLITNAENLLVLYVGEQYIKLTHWLIIWLLTVLLSMHNAPVASLVLSSGKTKFLVYSSGASCLLSIPITVALADKLDVGAAVLGYLVYIILQMICYYFYYIPKVLRLQPYNIFFRSFLPPTAAGILACMVAIQTKPYFSRFTVFSQLTIESSIFSIIFLLTLFSVVIGKNDYTLIREKLKL